MGVSVEGASAAGGVVAGTSPDAMEMPAMPVATPAAAVEMPAMRAGTRAIAVGTSALDAKITPHTQRESSAFPRKRGVIRCLVISRVSAETCANDPPPAHPACDHLLAVTRRADLVCLN